MRNFKSFAASALTAIATLSSITVSSPAQACSFCNGTKLNGIELNGLQLNGPVIQGPVLNGPVVQGISLQGVSLQGITLQGISLNGPATKGTQAGQYLAVTLPSGETVSLR